MKSKGIALVHSRILAPLKKVIKSGISIKRISVSLALGITIGLIPFYGITTILISVVALSLRLNFVAMQIAHYIVHPIQLALLIPFLKVASHIMPNSDVEFTLAEYVSLFKDNFWHAMQELWLVNLSAVLIWLLISIPLFIGLYYLIRKSIKKYSYLLVR